MSWMSYIDSLMGSKTMSHVGIFGSDGSTWASSPNYPLNQAQVKILIDSITKPAHVQENGLKISENEKYIFLRNDPEAKTTILKKGAAGIVVCKSTQAVIIGFHEPDIKAEITLQSIGRVVDYLSKNGY